MKRSCSTPAPRSCSRPAGSGPAALEPEADGRCHIRGVIGPDEYHEHIDDNAFTNVMARWNIRRALDVAALLRERWPERWASLSSRLGLDDTELKQWRKVAETMATGLDPKTGLFEQFAGFFALEEIDLADYAGRSVPMDVVLGRERTQQSQVIKQADVVALLALLPEEFAGETGAKNFRYYEPRCSHGSSLSRAMHGLVAARLGYSEMALRYFRQTAAIDLADTHVAIDGGVHIAALGGLWQTAVFGFAGLSLAERRHRPRPDDCRQIGAASAFGLQWRGRRLKIRIDQAKQLVEATLEAGEPMTLVVSGEPHELRRGQTLRVGIGKSDVLSAPSSPMTGSAARHGVGCQRRRQMELSLNLGDGVNQAADLISDATSIPTLNYMAPSQRRLHRVLQPSPLPREPGEPDPGGTSISARPRTFWPNGCASNVRPSNIGACNAARSPPKYQPQMRPALR